MPPPLPPPMQLLARDRHNRPVPWFVHWEGGAPDFRVIRPGGITDALRFELCWVCGTSRGRHAAFVIGPMCAVNRITAEPPAHLACAEWSAQACPFLATPTMQRRARGIDTGPDGPHTDPAGVMLARNPGVAAVWSSRTWSTFEAPGGLLFDVGTPSRVSWWAHGRPATRAEVQASLDSGMPALRAEAGRDRRPAEALADLDRMHAQALPLLPRDELR